MNMSSRTRWAPESMTESRQSQITIAMERCRANGWKLTPIRRRALMLMCQSDRPLGAYELLDRVGDGKTIPSPMRVYRALEFLTRHGFVRHLKSINAFVWCQQDHDVKDRPFLICDRCETAIPLTDTHAVELIRKSAARCGFKANIRTIEIRGLCSRCSAGVSDVLPAKSHSKTRPGN
jgi:Fur family transcriptional regulator, zinc uptake regulator